MITGLGKCWDEFSMGQYGKRDGAVRPVQEIAMPRLPRILALKIILLRRWKCEAETGAISPAGPWLILEGCFGARKRGFKAEKHLTTGHIYLNIIDLARSYSKDPTN